MIAAVASDVKGQRDRDRATIVLVEPRALPLVGKSYAKAHAITCTWALAIAAKSGAYTEVPGSRCRVAPRIADAVAGRKGRG